MQKQEALDQSAGGPVQGLGAQAPGGVETMTADKCLAKHKAFLYLSHLATLAGYYGDVARKERMYRAANRVIATIQDRTKA